jgi:adenylate cyclase
MRVAPEPGAAIYLFGDFELDLALHELRRAGVTCAIEPQAFDLLRYLIENRDRLIDRDELNEQLWQGRFVSDASLSTAVKLARQAIGDSGKTQDFIRTVPRRGFRFVGEVAVHGPDEPGQDAVPTAEPAYGQAAEALENRRLPPGKMPWIPAVAVALVMMVSTGLMFWYGAGPDKLSNKPSGAQVEKPSIAVLPFDNMSGDPEQDYFADGMTDDLITQLSKVNGLFVIARNSSFTYKGKNTKVQEIAQDLGVRYVLEGSVRRAEGKVRINAQLTDGKTGGHIWAEIFDRDAKDVFALQDDVIARIVTGLQVSLTADELKTLVAPPTRNSRAHELYLQARKAHRQLWPKPLKKALKLYTRARQMDPAFADAYAGEAAVAAHVARFNLFQVLGPKPAHQRARHAIAKALAIDPNHAGALIAKSFMLTTIASHDEAIVTARQAVTAHPNNATARRTLGEALYAAGKVQDALAEMEAALKLDPQPNKYDAFRTGEAYFLNRRYESALAFYKSVIARDPKYLQANNGLIITYAELGRLAEARKVVEQRIKGWAPFNVQATALHRDYWAPEVLAHWIGALRKGGAPEWPYGFKFDKANQLTGTELKALLLGHRLEGKGQSWGPFSMEIAHDGKWLWKNAKFNLTGTGHVEGDRWCYIHDAGLPDRKVCVHYYRNPTGTRELGNEYVNSDSYEIFWSSVVK